MDRLWTEFPEVNGGLCDAGYVLPIGAVLCDLPYNHEGIHRVSGANGNGGWFQIEFDIGIDPAILKARDLERGELIVLT